jgi:hypothetical protein
MIGLDWLVTAVTEQGLSGTADVGLPLEGKREDGSLNLPVSSNVGSSITIRSQEIHQRSYSSRTFTDNSKRNGKSYFIGELGHRPLP